MSNMSKRFLWSVVVAISLLGAGAVAALGLHSSPTATFAASAVSIDPSEVQATIKALPEQQVGDLI